MGGAPSPGQSDAGSTLAGKNSRHSQGPERMFLMRLRRLIWLRRSAAGQVDDTILKVLDKAIYSTYCDCLELEIGEEARDLLREAA